MNVNECELIFKNEEPHMNTNSDEMKNKHSSLAIGVHSRSFADNNQNFYTPKLEWKRMTYSLSKTRNFQ